MKTVKQLFIEQFGNNNVDFQLKFQGRTASIQDSYLTIFKKEVCFTTDYVKFGEGRIYYSIAKDFDDDMNFLCDEEKFAMQPIILKAYNNLREIAFNKQKIELNEHLSVALQNKPKIKTIKI